MTCRVSSPWIPLVHSALTSVTAVFRSPICFTKESPVFSLVMVLEVVQDFSASMLSNFPVASTALTPKVYVTPASSSFKVRLVPVVVLVYTATKQQCVHERNEGDTFVN